MSSKISLDSDSYLKIASDRYIFEESPENRGFLFNKKNGEILSLNKTASFIIKRLFAGTNTGELIISISKAFNTQQDKVKRDLLAFLDEMKSEGIIDD